MTFTADLRLASAAFVPGRCADRRRFIWRQLSIETGASPWRMLSRQIRKAGLVIVFIAAATHAETEPKQATFSPTAIDPKAAPSLSPAGMVWIPGGEFSMGSEDPRPSMCGGPDAMSDARPIHRVRVDGFWMDMTEVTNEQFAKFVAATGYVTIAERRPDPADFPGLHLKLSCRARLYSRPLPTP